MLSRCFRSTVSIPPLAIPVSVYMFQALVTTSECLERDKNFGPGTWATRIPILYEGGGQPTATCIYIDPNPITSLNNEGHNYFLSQNPYTLNSYAGFGEAYYNIANDLKLTGGLRWTGDRKHFIDIPSEVITRGYGYPITDVVNQQWNELTGRAAVNWTPKLDFTDQTLVYGSYARGYKAGGANPPGAVLDSGEINGATDIAEPVHPLTFKPEFVNAFELGSKNTLLDGALTLNGDVFYYDYKDYQISEIVDRTSINLNFNAKVKGAELESTWEPVPGLRFNFADGYEDTRVANGQSAIDLMDRTAGTPGWMVVKPFVTETSNCILPTYVVQALLEESRARSVGKLRGRARPLPAMRLMFSIWIRPRSTHICQIPAERAVLGTMVADRAALFLFPAGISVSTRQPRPTMAKELRRT